MNRPERDVLERLGRAGIVRALEDLLDQGRLHKLAHAVGLNYPGMRLQTLRRERVLGDLADKALRDDAAGKSVVRTLRKQTQDAARAWAALAPDERIRRLDDTSAVGRNGALGLHLFLAASSAAESVVEESLGARLGGLSKLPENAPAAEEPTPIGADAAREVVRLRKKSAELQKKTRHLETQIEKGRETEKALKRDLIQRKGELAEARMLAERLRRELDEIKGTAGAQASRPASAPAAEVVMSEIERTLKRLAADHKKLAHRVEKLAEPPAAPAEAGPSAAEAVAPVLGAIAALEKEVASLRRERRKDLVDQAKRLDELQAVARATRDAAEAAPRPARAVARRKGELERVGVFIDVQNMYYAARQLKGKLDFDALLAAAILDRRLIQATAYVVETKEIDQSGFIAMLQQRAIEVRRKTLQIRADGSMKGDWDMEMALDILDMAPKLDIVALVSGDGDFTSLVKRVKSMGPKVEVLAFPRNTAKSLVEAADRFQPLDRKYMIRTEPPAAHPEPATAPAEDSKPEAAPAEPTLAGVKS